MVSTRSRLNADFHVFTASFVVTTKIIQRRFTPSIFYLSVLALPVFLVFTVQVITSLSPNSASLGGYRTYAVLGLALIGNIFSVFLGAGAALRQEQILGTLESLLVTPGSKVAWLLGRVLSDIINSSITFVIVIAVSELTFGLQLSPGGNIPTAVAAFVLMVFSLACLSILYAPLLLVLKDQFSLTNLLLPLFIILSGMAFPLSLLPSWAQAVGNLLPFTPAADIFRRALIGDSLSTPVIAGELSSVAAESVVIALAGWIFLKLLERRIMRISSFESY